MGTYSKTKEELLKELEELKLENESLKAQFGKEITEEKKSEEISRIILKTAMDGFWRADIDGHILEVNESYCRMSGYSEHELLTMSISDLEEAETREDTYRHIQNIMTKGEDRFESKHRRKDGSVYDVDVSVQYQLKKGGRLVVFLHDITERKRVQEQNKAILRTTIDGFYIVDSEGKILEVNDSYCSMVGYSREELLKMKIKDFEAVETDEVIKKRIQRILETGKDFFETKHTRKDGKVIAIEASGNILMDKEPKFSCFMRDITERKRAEETLRMYEQTFRSINGVINVADLNDDILFVNPAFCKTYGYTEKELLGKSSSIFWSDRNPKEVVNQILPATLKGGWKGELFNKRKDGTEFPIYLSTSVIKNDSGEPIAVVGIVEDITKRKRAELERQILYEITEGITTTSNLEELFNLIHKSLRKVVYAENCFIALYDEKTNLFGFPYWVDKFDPTPEPFAMLKSCTAYIFKTGKPLLLTQELFDNLVEQNEVELVGTNAPSWVGVPLKTPDMTIGVLVLQHYEEENVYSERDVQFLDSVGSQIALAIERKRTEDELKESEEMFRRLFDESNDPILLLDETGFFDCNPSTVSLLGYTSKEEFLNKKPWELSPEKQPDRQLSSVKAKMMINKAIAEGYNRFEWIHTKSDGSDVPVEVMLTPIQLKGKQILYTIWRDIAERKRTEEFIQQQNEQLQELNATKDKFFSIIAHDLRSPFQGFLNLTQMMAESGGDFTKEEIVAYSKEMHKNASNLYQLLHNLLEWAHSQKGTIEFEPEKLGLKKLVDEDIQTIKERAAQKGITIINEVTENQKVVADEKMINTILRNLLSNAVKFTHRDGTITVKVNKTENQMIEISIRDTGVGMQKNVIEILFKAGEKIGSKGTDGEPSTGLGLVLCKEFVEKHGGRIWVESEEGKGSKFYFTLSKQGE
ncbi:MAG: PAS domain S-box protein [Ignavibacteriaceae bacterium]|jgi:PAS domain S-box-containing protein|nr:PAS domain S-box protein [Ignavibacteriaceae bacterium]